MTTYISNSFALSMIPDGAIIRTKVVNLPLIARKLSNPRSVVGHADTARVFSSLLGIPIAHNRETISLTPTDRLYVGQLIGGRLPEGATTLPEGFQIKWICVSIDTDPTPMIRHWAKGDSSIYGSIDRVADQVANLVDGEVSLMQDSWGNPHWEIKALGFYGCFHDD